MSAALIAALCFTGALLLTTAYFVMGGAPLLTLQHDTPKDARFVGSFFSAYYRAAMFIAAATAVCYAFAGRLAFAAGAAALALLAALLRRKLITKMASLGERIEGGEPRAIPAFRRLHAAAILINLAQLVLIVWSLISVSLEFRQAPAVRAGLPFDAPPAASFERAAKQPLTRAG
ncbi:MAG: hypothetical protein ABL916_11060 [Burkholderiaceae bacterium]